MSNDILKYTSRDYESIKADLIDSISTLTDTWTSRDDGDPGIVLVKLMSALGDMLSFNHDKQALEYYAPTVTQRKNASKLFNLVGYKMHWYRSAKTMLTLVNRAQMPEYMYLYKKIIDGANPTSVYYDYRKRYTVATSETTGTISCPPAGTQAPSGITQSTLQLEDNSETLEAVDVDDAVGTTVFVSDAMGWFSDNAINIYKAWQNDNVVGIHQYIEDQFKTLNVYSSGSSALTYTLIPTDKEPSVDPSTGYYEPTIKLKPYERVQVPAIQGYLCSTSFTNAQLKDNRFYIPDSRVDEDCMFVAYITIDDATQQEKQVFLKKTDNLLKITKFKDDEEKTIIYYQFGVDEFDYPYIELASYWKSVLTEDSIKFIFYYIRTQGKYGNISDNFLTSIDTGGNGEVTVENIATTSYVANPAGDVIASPGYNPETASEAYANSINYIMTYDTLVTIYDFTRFLKRQPGISNGFACDNQYAIDLNTEIQNKCNAYTKEQLLDILGAIYDSDGHNVLEDMSQADLASYLYEIRKVVYDYKQGYITKDDVDSKKAQTDFVSYSINLYPICGAFDVEDAEMKPIATYTNRDSSNRPLPYYIYAINTEESVGSENKEDCTIETMIDENLSDTRIVNVDARYTGCRVFPWRCCGTIHLTQSVSQIEADNIIKSVIDNLRIMYAPENISFGQKITYMDVIETIMQSDDRIRYFDAGIGDKKLIEFENNLSQNDGYFNIEAYFNPESIMHYVQTFKEVKSETSEYRNMICVDPTYIQSSQ